MENIIVGFDASRAAESALDWVTDRAHRHPVSIELVAVANMFVSGRADVHERLEAAEARLRARLPGVVVDSQLLDGVMPGTLIHAARDAQLLVIGVDREHPVLRALNGWMPLRVAVRSHLPTCLVPAGWAPVDGPVFVGVDEDSSDDALLFAAAEASETGARLRIVHAWADDSPRRTSSSVTTAARAHATHGTLLRRAAQRAQQAFPDLRIETDLICEDDPANVLRSLAAEGALVVLGTHGRGLVAGALSGSVARGVMWELSGPVCVVPDAEHRPPE